jgi:hypothetical protein
MRLKPPQAHGPDRLQHNVAHSLRIDSTQTMTLPNGLVPTCWYLGKFYW